ncbi:hypothetical protein E2562_036638 [Oryza meyeriana var. granulata]|uniref:Uncharacterized protein n=1 Tax=Oryza meyeriana var. granulata TaxID=110450 RepID=A0A6G1DAL9_9ORYZ|nr:hypothetical protein E2562_036638 [Oryza meyeriana var. granulata]
MADMGARRRQQGQGGRGWEERPHQCSGGHGGTTVWSSLLDSSMALGTPTRIGRWHRSWEVEVG